ncbi:MAG: Flp pilus assembly protein CpaB [Anaerolineae bacterium]|nr:Flp pilus assembly protein CpaB [Anaerolineae bacterium]
MRGGGRIFVILGFILALIAGVAVFIVLASAEPQPTQVPTTDLVVAVQQIPARSEVSPDQLGLVPWPVPIPTPIGAYASPAEVVGQLSLVPIYVGQPVIDDMVISKGDVEAQHSNAALLLEEGQVAVALGVSLGSNVAEAIQPGDRVDLVVTYNVEVQNPISAIGSGSYVVTQKTLENVLILQVGPWPRDVGEQSSSQGGGAVNIVTLQMVEQDALALKHIESTAANYAFVLRAANDEQLYTTEPVTIEYINRRFNFNIPGLGQ